MENIFTFFNDIEILQTKPVLRYFGNDRTSFFILRKKCQAPFGKLNGAWHFSFAKDLFVNFVAFGP
ncbi:hypothetical protein BIV60_21670 [Bacillus sp. MUM 116]|nr:hypothetical protein BIV60_21670 [Bacillus sp. MUM 116]